METSSTASRVFDVLAENPITRGMTKVMDKLRFPKAVLSDLYKFVFGGTQTSRLQKVLFLVGSLVLLRKIIVGGVGLYRSLKWVPEHIQLYRKYDADELKRRYGNDTWVLITGFTAGMGLAYAKAFADMGFNLVLVGRNKEKIKYALRWIAEHNDQILTKVVDLDLAADADTIRTTIKQATEDIDVGIVINNAGTNCLGLCTDISISKHIYVYRVNTMLAVEVCRVFVPRMRRRQRSAIVNVGSAMSVFPSPVLGLYPATKLYIEKFTQALAEEYKGKIDVLLLVPLGVTTDMTGGFKGTFMATPEEVVRSTIINIGKTTYSFGPLLHKISATLLEKMTQEQRFALLSGNFMKMKQAANRS